MGWWQEALGYGRTWPTDLRDVGSDISAKLGTLRTGGIWNVEFPLGTWGTVTRPPPDELGVDRV